MIDAIRNAIVDGGDQSLAGKLIEEPHELSPVTSL
jgi:hypothetical protein